MIDVTKIQEWMPERRWFGGKGRTIDAVSVIDHVAIYEEDPALVMAILRVTYADGSDEVYSAPLMVAADGSSWDPFDEPERLRIIGQLMAHGESFKGDAGVFHFGGPGLDPLAPPGQESVRVLGVEQSNSSVVYDDRVILKVFRRPGLGPNPELELNRLLTNEGFRDVPPQVGEILYEGNVDGEEVEVDLGIAQEFVHEGREGWDAALQGLREVYDAIHPEDAREDIRFLVEERGADLLRSIEELGDVTGALHIVLSREEIDPHLAPEDIGPEDLREWAKSARTTLAGLTTDGFEELEPLRPEIEDRIDRLEKVSEPGFKTRIQGDFHLAQVMLSPRGWLILDFEGEPARPLEERRRKQSPLRDVAGMLRSFSYAATAALFERAQPDDDEWKRLAPWANEWEEVARARYLTAYLRKTHEGRFIPSDRGELATMLDFFELDKALYELGYERANRPDWVRIPLRGIRDVLQRRAG